MSNRSRPLTLFNPAGLYDPSANGYTHVASIAAGSRLVHVAGQGGETEDGALAPDFRQHVRQAHLCLSPLPNLARNEEVPANNNDHGDRRHDGRDQHGPLRGRVGGVRVSLDAGKFPVAR